MAEYNAKQTQKERLKEITDSIEMGIKEMMTSEKYSQYLRTVSRFHKYSLNNTMLIAMQNPDATLVAGYNKWKDSFSRNVKKGEKGIKIIAPTPYKVKEEREKLDPATNLPLLDENGKIQIEEIEKQMPMFRVVSVFDVSQTEGKEIPSLINDLSGNVEYFDAFMEAIKRTSQVQINIEKMADDVDGFYSLDKKSISIRDGMSEVQTVSATIHEVAHSLLHDREVVTETQKKDRRTEEIEAESISFAVCNYYGIETSDNSFGYIANWSKEKDLKELKSSLEAINKTSSQIITGIDKHFAEIVKERGIDLNKEEELAFEYDKRYISIFEVDDGYEYSIIDENFNILDGGIYDDIETSIDDAVKEILLGEGESLKNDLSNLKKVDFKKLMEKASEVESEKIKKIKLDKDTLQVKDNKSDEKPIVGLKDMEKEVTSEYDFEEIDKSYFDEAVLTDNKGRIVDKEECAHEVNRIETPYFMPDSNVTTKHAVEYGYTAEELLPLAKERAFDLYNEDLTIYALYPDNTEAMIFDAIEIESHAGYFGIEKVDWENFYEFKEQLVLENSLTPLEEKKFLENTENSFAIYQIKEGAEFRDYRFANLRELESTGKEIDRKNYNLVWSSRLQNVSSVDDALNSLYHDFNNNRSSEFKCHSMSVSDIVVIKMNGVVSSHYVDSFGFKEVENYLKVAELSTEQNLNKIDGVINNEPTVEQLEKDVNEGKAISLIDLANAVNKEKKSVLAELKTSKSIEYKEKNRTANSKEMER